MRDRRTYVNNPRRQSSNAQSPCPNEEFGTKRTVIVLVIIVGCFAVVWPKLLYPILVSKSTPLPKQDGCCDVISELDIDTIKIMSELCGTVIEQPEGTTLSRKEILSHCKKVVFDKCGIDLSAALNGSVFLGHSIRQILEEVRSLNGSLCLKHYFGVAPWKLGLPHRVNLNLEPVNTIKQERRSIINPEKVHPALKERGRAIYGAHEVSTEMRRRRPPPVIVEGRPGPIPGRRPFIGVPGQIAPSKISNYGLMGVLMPIYTIAFIIFFTYIVKQIVYKKKPVNYVGSPLYPPCDSDEQFEQQVFQTPQHYFNRPNKDTSKIVVNAVAALLEEVNQAVEEHKNKLSSEASTEQDTVKVNGALPKGDEQGSVTVLGMETRASCENGAKWSRPHSPVLPHPEPTAPKEPSLTPQQIFLEGALPPQSQILVADSATEAQVDAEDDSSVILAGKMTLSVISLDSEPGSEESSNFGRKNESSDEEGKTSSSNISEEFEKIHASDLEDHINSVIEEAANVVAAKVMSRSPENQFEDIQGAIRNDFKLPEDLLQALKDDDAESSVRQFLEDCLGDEEQFSTTGSESLGGVTNCENSDNLEHAIGSTDEDKTLIAQGNICEEPHHSLGGPSTEEIGKSDLDGFREVQACKVEDKRNGDHNSQFKEDNKTSPVNALNLEASKEWKSRDSDNDEHESKRNDLREAHLGDNCQSEEELMQDRVNGQEAVVLGNIDTLTENNIFKNEIDDDEDELDEVIEYEHNTEDEGEEVVEIDDDNRNPHGHQT